MLPDLQDVLRIGAYQLTALDRVPGHAAVDTAVTLADRLAGPRRAAFVNAILRRVAAEGSTADAQTPQDGAGPAALARAYSHPAWLVERWVTRYGSEQAEALLRHNNTPPPVYLQPAAWHTDALVAALEAAGVGWKRAGADGLAVRGVRVEELPGYAEGGFIVQDPSQAKALAFAALPGESRIWDACAAPGGKAAALGRRCRVFASDRSCARVRRLAATVRRAAPSVRIAVADARHPPLAPAAMDAVLLDAPCTATGTFAKHPDARWRLKPTAPRRLAALQRELLEAVAEVVRPGGLLIYMTCSLEPEENEAQVDRFLRRHADFRRTREDLVLFPPASGSDGAYAARLVRAT